MTVVKGIEKLKPVIGILPLWDDDKDSIWMLPGYSDGIREAGGLPFIFPFTFDKEDLSQLVDMCDGILFTGGQDVSPDIYGEKPLSDKVVCSAIRDRMEKTILKLALKRDLPILGICRGLQFINASLGGTLYQDLPSQKPSSTVHLQDHPYFANVHSVTIIDDSPLFTLLKEKRIGVNSLHHQAVKTLAPSLKPMAISEDGLIEAAYKPEQHFAWAVQWHPEYTFPSDKNSMLIFRKFVEECLNSKKSA